MTQRLANHLAGVVRRGPFKGELARPYMNSPTTTREAVIMLFGEKSEFAMQAQFDGAEGNWRFGRLRLWVSGQAIGDFDDTCDLAGSARSGRQFLEASFRRTRPDLESKNGSEVYWLLYGRCLKRGATLPGEPWDRDRFVLDDVGESALRDRASLVAVRRSDGRDRILIRADNRETMDEDLSINRAWFQPGDHFAVAAKQIGRGVRMA